MIQATNTINKSFVAGGTITKGAIVMFVTDDDTVIVATASTDFPIGVALEAALVNERVQVAVSGIAEVKAGDVITRGQPVTSEAAGAGLNVVLTGTALKKWVGIAMATAADGDIVPVLIAPSMGITAVA